MSWNPRRMVGELHADPIFAGDPTVLWLTADAVDRIESAVEHATDEVPTVVPTAEMPDDSIIIGLGRRLETPLGAGSIISVAGLATIKENYRLDAVVGGVDYPAGLDSVVSLKGLTRIYSLADRRFFELGQGGFRLPNWTPDPLTEAEAEMVYRDQVLGIDLPPIEVFHTEQALRLTAFIRAVWTLAHEDDERDATATTLTAQSVTMGNKRKARNHEVQVVDIRRRADTASGAARGDGEPLDHDFRWRVRGHWRNQAYGPEQSLRRMTWIDEQVRGPEDKPIKPRVNVIHGADVGG